MEIYFLPLARGYQTNCEKNENIVKKISIEGNVQREQGPSIFPPFKIRFCIVFPFAQRVFLLGKQGTEIYRYVREPVEPRVVIDWQRVIGRAIRELIKEEKVRGKRRKNRGKGRKNRDFGVDREWQVPVRRITNSLITGLRRSGP